MSKVQLDAPCFKAAKEFKMGLEYLISAVSETKMDMKASEDRGPIEMLLRDLEGSRFIVAAIHDRVMACELRERQRELSFLEFQELSDAVGGVER